MTRRGTAITERQVRILNRLDVPVHVAVAQKTHDSFMYFVSPRQVPLPMAGAIVHREDLGPNEGLKATGLSPTEIPIVSLQGWDAKPKLSLAHGVDDKGVHRLTFILRPQDPPAEEGSP